MALAAAGLGFAATAAWAAPGTFSATGSLQVGRYGSAATTLCDGRVLVAGGDTAGGQATTAEIYQPSTGTWVAAAPLNVARSSHSSTLLADCRILVAGGGSGAQRGSAEIYDPGTDTWTEVASMNVGRHGHSAFRLPDGRVLVAAGGVPVPGDTAGTASAELFDPSTGSWTATGSLATGRLNHAAAQLADGRVVVAGGMPHGGGYFGPGFDTAEVYDPSTGAWAYTASPMATPRRGFHSLTRLDDGRLLVAGGHTSWTGTATDTAELLDPATLTWTATTSMPAGRYFHAATVLTGGTVLVTGGSNGSSYLVDADVYDPTTATWSPAGSDLAGARGQHESVRLADGTVLVAGGWDGANQLASAEVYSPPLTMVGFHNPVEMRTPSNPTALNTVKSGATVPVKFEVFAGTTELTDVAVVTAVSAAQVTCTPGAEDPIEEIVPDSAGGTALRHDSASGQFVYNWKTPSKSAGRCYVVTVTVQGGSSLSAWFKLT